MALFYCTRVNERITLKIEQTYLEDHQLEVVVEADQDAFEKAKHLAAKELAKGKDIRGFRPGKAPYQRIVNLFGEAAVIDQALEHFLDEIYPKILDEIDQETYGPGQVKEIKGFEPPTFVFNIPLQPEVSLGDYRGIRLPYQTTDISDDDIQQVLDNMRSKQASVEPVDHPAEEGNLVDTTINCRPVDSEPDDLDSYLLKNQPLPVMIKTETENDSNEWPFPGFSRQLLGVSAGDALELIHQFPDQETVDEDYRGKEFLYTVSVTGIQERVLPDLDNEFVKLVSDLESVEELKEQIQEELAAQRKVEEENEYINQILEKIVEESQVKYPPQMLENEVEGEIQELESRLEAQGMDLEMYLNIQNLDQEELREQIKPNAMKRIRNGLIIGKISETEDLDINPEDITGEFQTVIDDHFGEDQKARDEYMNSGESIALLNRISSQMVTKKTLDFLKTVAQGNDPSAFLKAAEQETQDVSEAELDERKEIKDETDPDTDSKREDDKQD
jgi:trigger factor